MTLIKWINKPSIINDLDYWLNNLSIDSPINFYNKSQSFIPQFEVREIEDSYQIFAELPGMNKKDVGIEISDSVITVFGEKAKSENKDNNNYSEMSGAKFSRSFKLPEDIITDKVTAKMKDGILAVFVPRMKSVKLETTKIAIK